MFNILQERIKQLELQVEELQQENEQLAMELDLHKRGMQALMEQIAKFLRGEHTIE